ncbi:beta-propeller fold lactonase family protein [Chryseobacterium sp.]|uniref:lactonase family protein n=1 Tax=Chryseobacterium sp. TaxID=1871047 RepID=UPI0024E232BE|nr:beta-propeller fold lactonase family protein [Chryseobacterium sp.]
MKKTLSSVFIILAFIKLYSQNTYVFFGSFNRDKTTEGIYVYELDTLKGKLSKVTSVKGILNPSFLTLSPNGKYIFACTESKTKNAGSVSSFAFNPIDKKLTFINSQKSGGENPVYVTAHQNGKWLINGNYTEGSVSVYPVLENGSIQPAVQNFQFLEDRNALTSTPLFFHPILIIFFFRIWEQTKSEVIILKMKNMNLYHLQNLLLHKLF